MLVWFLPGLKLIGKVPFWVMVFSVLCLNLRAQSILKEVISNGGDQMKNATISLNWTLGELAISSYSVADYTLGEGFHRHTNPGHSTSFPEMNFSTLKIWPNPTKGKINIDLTDLGTPQKMEIANLLGKRFKFESNISDPVLDLSHLPEGIYNLILHVGNDQLFITRFIKVN